MDPFIGQIIGFGGNFAVRGWAICEGQLLSIPQFSALFSILGTTYGGDGRTTFALPDLRGRIPMQAGTGAGLQPITLGERGGNETTTLTLQNLPSHNHTAAFNLGAGVGNVGTGAGGYVAANSLGETIFTANAPNGSAALGAASVSVGNNGGSGAFSNRSPYLGINMLIALVGTFPSRN